MRRVIALAVLAAFVTVTVPPARAQPKVKRCLSPADQKTEQIIRHGIFLREGSRNCNEMKPGLAKQWTDFDTKFAKNLSGQTAKRAKLFQREFKDKATEVMTYFDGRLVTYYRYYPITVSYCEHVGELLTELGKRGWGGFVKQSEATENDVRTDLKLCG